MSEISRLRYLLAAGVATAVGFTAAGGFSSRHNEQNSAPTQPAVPNAICHPHYSKEKRFKLSAERTDFLAGVSTKFIKEMSKNGSAISPDNEIPAAITKSEQKDGARIVRLLIPFRNSQADVANAGIIGLAIGQANDNPEFRVMAPERAEGPSRKYPLEIEIEKLKCR